MSPILLSVKMKQVDVLSQGKFYITVNLGPVVQN